MSHLIYSAIASLLRLHDRLYGKGASREVLRDLSGDWQVEPRVQWRDFSRTGREALRP